MTIVDPLEVLVEHARNAAAPVASRQAAFGLIVERLQDAAYQWALAVLGDRHLATDAGQLDATRFLLRQGAKVNAPDRAGMTPLAWAERANRDAVAAVLRKSSG